jgi:type II secretory pathway pseudopilin PulG
MRRLRRAFTMIEALMAITLAGVGVAAVVGAMGSVTHAEATALEHEKMQRLAIDKYDELVATQDYNNVSSGNFQDRSEDSYDWTCDIETTGVDGLDELTVTVRRSAGDREVELVVSGLIYANQTTAAGGQG